MTPAEIVQAAQALIAAIQAAEANAPQIESALQSIVTAFQPVVADCKAVFEAAETAIKKVV